MSEGETFGAYRVVRKLGQGGMGAVFLGEHKLIGRRAAIKVLRRERSAQRENVERFFTEARATSAVEDPGIVQIYDFGVTDAGTAYLVMEFLDGEALSARLRRHGPLSPYDAVRMTRQLAGSLAAAHATGIVHRDLKPENLFVVRDAEAAGGERPKILDFGIAKLADENERVHTRTGAVLGTPAYMSPEQCDAGKIDHRTDIYSLGCVLFHLLVGRPPFDFEGVGTIIAAHLREPPPVPSVVAPQVPAIVDPIVARCLAKQPGDRYASMTELQEACDAILPQLPLEPPTVRDPVRPSTHHPEHATTLATSVGESSGPVHAMRLPARVAIGVAAVAAGVVLALATTRHAAEPAPAAATSVPLRAPAAAPAPPPIVQPIEPPAPVAQPAPPPPAVVPAAHPVKPAPSKRAPKKLPQGDVYEDRI